MKNSIELEDIESEDNENKKIINISSLQLKNIKRNDKDSFDNDDFDNDQIRKHKEKQRIKRVVTETIKWNFTTEELEYSNQLKLLNSL